MIGRSPQKFEQQRKRGDDHGEAALSVGRTPFAPAGWLIGSVQAAWPRGTTPVLYRAAAHRSAAAMSARLSVVDGCLHPQRAPRKPRWHNRPCRTRCRAATHMRELKQALVKVDVVAGDRQIPRGPRPAVVFIHPRLRRQGASVWRGAIAGLDPYQRIWLDAGEVHHPNAPSAACSGKAHAPIGRPTEAKAMIAAHHVIAAERFSDRG